MPYGQELILDLYDCDVSKFNRENLIKYFEELCNIIDMERCELHFWDSEDLEEGEDEDPKFLLPHTKGVSAIQFIITSSIVIHTLDIMKDVYINIFSCKAFNTNDALKFSIEFFNADDYQYTSLNRGSKRDII